MVDDTTAETFVNRKRIKCTNKGEKEVTLTAAQSGLPAHNHVTEKYELQTSNVQANGFTWPPLWSGTSPNVNTTQNCPPQNAQQPHENRPPYFVIAYIIKVTY